MLRALLERRLVKIVGKKDEPGRPLLYGTTQRFLEVFGLRDLSDLPDAIASYSVGGQTYLVTANEGDARADWPGFNEETRVRAHCTAGLDPAVFPDAANLILDSNLGRLRITATPNGGSAGKNVSGQCNELYSFGARSFTISTNPS